jgi:hypothetical protein
MDLSLGLSTVYTIADEPTTGRKASSRWHIAGRFLAESGRKTPLRGLL